MVEDNDTGRDERGSENVASSGQSGPNGATERLGGDQPIQGQPGQRSGGGDGGSWLPRSTRWTPLTILAVVVLVGGVAAAGVFVATGADVPILGDSGGSASLDAVPDDVDVVVYADGRIVDDETTETMMNGALELSSQNPTYSGPSSYDELLAEANGETDLDVDAFDSATMFATYPEGPAATTEYVGFVVESDWSKADIVNSIEQNSGTVQERTYAGTTVYVQPSEFGTDTWLAPLGDGTFAVGSETAVSDAIDVENGDMSTLSGDLRDSFGDLRDGYVKFAATLPEDVTEQTGVPQGGQMARNVRAASGVYYTSGSDVGMELHLTGTDQSSADSVKESIDGLLSFATVGSQDSPTADLIDAVTVSQDGRQVTISFEYAAEELVSVMEQLSGTGMAA